MEFKEITPKLQLNFEEYVDVWGSLLTEYYSRGLDSAAAQALDEQKLAKYGLELATVVLIIGMRIWNGRKGFSDATKKKVHDEVVSSYYEGIYGGEPAFLKDCLEFYESKRRIFDELCPSLGSANEKTYAKELIGMARYLAAQASDVPESQNQKAIESTGMLLLSVGGACSRLANNTGQAMQIAGKPKFVVEK